MIWSRLVVVWLVGVAVLTLVYSDSFWMFLLDSWQMYGDETQRARLQTGQMSPSPLQGLPVKAKAVFYLSNRGFEAKNANPLQAKSGYS